MSTLEQGPRLRHGAELFLKYNYPETKDLCKQFLTLVAAVLVFSLTFSEKIVKFPDATPLPRTLILLAWCSMLGAIVACGVGLTLITLAAGDAVYGHDTDDGGTARYHRLAQRAYILIVLGGAGFVVGLLLLVATAVVATRSATPEPNQQTTGRAAVRASSLLSYPA